MKFVLHLTPEDKPYIGFLEKLIGGHNSLAIHYVPPSTLTEMLMEGDAVLVTDNTVLKMLTGKRKCTLDDYVGSFWLKKDARGIEKSVLCLPHLKQLISTKPGPFLFKRFLTKITKPSEWFEAPPFKWSLCDDIIACSTAYNKFLGSHCIAVDIETSPAYLSWEEKSDPQHVITCVSYTALYFIGDGNKFRLETIVIPLKSLELLEWIKKFNSLPQPKVFQNGKYDNFYFLRYAAPVTNWLFDTLEAHHCLFAELPKDLAYQTAFYLREVSYWKDEGQTGNLEDLYRYNAKDSWATMVVFMVWLKEAPSWAIQNYLIKFPLVYPCLACEVDGLIVHEPTRLRLEKEQTEIAARSLNSLRKKIGYPSFNPNSPKQVLQLLHILGCGDLKGSGVKELEKAADRHPIVRLLTDEITSYRESTKLISTYLGAELWGGKLLYTLNPSGTDTGRLASGKSALWCGTQLQNQPSYFKQALWAEDGYFLGEGDFKQSETFCTAYLSGDPNLLAAVLSPKDFHATNASSFFGLSYEEILKEEEDAKRLPVKPFTIRDLSKRVNHGSTYNMGAVVLLVTMGMRNVLRAKVLLKLPANMKPLQVTQFLLDRFNETYSTIKGDFYASIVSSIRLTRMLVSELGWTRLCFGTPWASKPDLNSYVAHVPSNLSVGIINECFQELFWSLHMKCGGDFRLKGQIHDSILFAYKEGRDDLVGEVKRIMTKTKVIADCHGVKREMTIPVDMKAGDRCWARLKKWSPSQTSHNSNKEKE